MRSARIKNRAGLIHGCANHFLARLLGRRHWLTGDHRFIDVAFAIDNHTVDRDFLAGPHAEHVIFLNLVHGDFLFLTIANSVRSFCSKTEQRLDRMAGTASRSSLDQLSQQDQGCNHRGCFKIKLDFSMTLERNREKCQARLLQRRCRSKLRQHPRR